MRIQRHLLALIAVLLSFPACSQWRYSQTKDPMTDEPLYNAFLSSSKKIQSLVKGQRSAPALLHLSWRSGRIESAIILVVSAAVDCERGCHVRVRHDDDTPLFHPAESTANALLKFEGPQYIADGLHQNRRLRVELPLLNAPKLVVEFQVHGLQPP